MFDKLIDSNPAKDIETFVVVVNLVPYRHQEMRDSLANPSIPNSWYLRQTKMHLHFGQFLGNSLAEFLGLFQPFDKSPIFSDIARRLGQAQKDVVLQLSYSYLHSAVTDSFSSA